MTEVEHDFREPTDIEGKKIKSYDISPKCPQKRLSVMAGWLMDAVFDGINAFNHVTRARAYLKQLKHLREAYPIHDELGHIDEINLLFWARYQEVYKTELKPAIEQAKREQIKRDLQRMRF